jgi:hypothetical protein
MSIFLNLPILILSTCFNRHWTSYGSLDPSPHTVAIHLHHSKHHERGIESFGSMTTQDVGRCAVVQSVSGRDTVPYREAFKRLGATHAGYLRGVQKPRGHKRTVA